MLRALALVLSLALMPIAARAAAPVEGRHYASVEDGKPLAPSPGRIEVVEVFAYWCDHCARFAPMLEAWKARQAKDVRLAYLPLPSGRNDPLARGFFATQDAGALGKVHGPLFEAMHGSGSMPRNPSIDELAAYYGQRGLNAAKIKAAMEQPALADRLAAARQFALRSGVEGTPTLVIDGRYRILGRTLEEYLANADAVIAHIREGKRPAPAGR
jgi:protein dithiol oxidoreductase (disulfide-forming)